MAKPSRREWADFEQLIARIETTLAPSGAAIRCPDNHVLDLDTGECRNVDATIRFEEQGRAVFVALECRRRGRRQTVQWVEELVAKKASIGATRLIGVSSHGFAKNAIKKASVRGVELRSARALADASVAEWIAFDAVELINVRWSVTQALIELVDPQHDDALVLNSGSTAPWTAATDCFSFDGLESLVSLEWLVRNARQNTPWPPVPAGQIITVPFAIKCDGMVAAPTNSGFKKVRVVHVQCALQEVISFGARTAAVAYESPAHPLLDAVHFDISAAIPGAVFAFHRDSTTGETSLSIVPQPTPG
jgi:Restriction endonuclease